MTAKFARCIRHGGYPESLLPGKTYKVVADPEAAAVGLLRVVDESGEDYLYPQSCFAAPRRTAVKRKSVPSHRQ